MKLSDFDYELPPELIAREPLPERSASRLLVLRLSDGALEDRRVAELPQILSPGDLLVFNDTRVIPARLEARKPSGGRVEVLIERLLDGRQALALLGSSRKPRPGAALGLAGGASLRVVERRGDFWLLAYDGPGTLGEYLERFGTVPLPPYLGREAEARDRERYQTVFAREPGAVAAPTAGLHFDASLLQALRARGIEQALLTLHVGAGTFLPVREEDPRRHRMHAERYRIPPQLVDAILRCRARGGRVVAIGTTVVRALESAAQGGELRAGEGESELFIYPGYRFLAVDALFTNFHLPRSTLVMLVAAFAGRERVLAAYRHAVEARYRFYSYGDAMLIL
jgi:S-adenosylmethionine:tRNA ribosyltransferase-isomerase